MTEPGRFPGKTLIAVTLLAVLVGGLISGCTALRKPAPSDREVGSREPVITLYVNETGAKKRIKIEDYIAGVVAAEMEPNWPREALAAQAIIARTFTMQKIKYEKGVPRHQADASTNTEEFQAYNPGKINDNVRQAVKMTRGMVIRYKGRYARTWFHSNAGGKTATALEGLDFNKEATPYVQVVSDPGQQVAPPEERSWKVSFPLEEVRSVVRKQTGQDPGVITSAAVVQRGPSGRATRIRLGGVTVSGPSLRLALGAEAMKSTLIDRIEVSDGQLLIAGRGRGHGVGMSQWGAYYQAKHGKSAAEIIRYYFRGVTIDRIWS